MIKVGTKLRKALFSMFLIGAIIVGGMAAPSPVKAAPIKILPVGDSCTEGMGDPDWGSYRTELYRLYKEAGLDFDFVGSNKGGPSSLPDKDNEGHSGWTIPQVASSIDNWLNTHNPDVVFLWIGGNDIFQTGQINPTGLSNLIDQIFRTKPNVKIFVADYYPNPDIVLPYNATIPGVVQSKANAGKPVYFVKLSDMGYVKSEDTSSDGLHLNPAGYKKAAKVWFDSTISILKGNTTNPNNPQIIKGDVDGDGSVNSIDFLNMKKYLLDLISTFPSPNGFKAADINDDGKVNSVDFMALKLILLEK